MSELLLGLVGATEAAARAAADQVGRGDKLAVDRAATDALRGALDRLPFRARVAIGEGEKDRAPGLFAGEVVGRGDGEATHDLAVDPIDGTTQAARGGPDALAVLAVGSAGCLYSTRAYYVQKIAVGPEVARGLGGLAKDLAHLPTGELIEVIARARGKSAREVTVALLDRPRHARMLAELREIGCAVRLHDCDVAASVAVGLPDSGADVCLGIGGAPEAVLTAAALKCLGGDFQARPLQPDGTPVEGRVLHLDDLARGEVLFAATGVTDGCLLGGPHRAGHAILTHSLAMSSADRAVRWIETRV
jgi:fructose-1,6-bisphosphatase II / sedoheptulose-1,7-bisphosphatase